MHFNIQRFSTHDGDGIRTILFLKGCSLTCTWCQNPESLSPKHSLLFDEKLCISECDDCARLCPSITRDVTQNDSRLIIDRESLKKENLIPLKNVCPSKALTVCGEDASEEELFEILLRDKAFYDQSGGGITFSGGEPLLQSELVASLAEKLQGAGVTCAIETCMHVPWRKIEPVIPFIDCWLTDLKHTDDEKFHKWASGSLARIKANFKKLDTYGKRVIIRVPVVPEFNDTEEELASIIDFAAELNSCNELHLLPYHSLGMSKYHMLDQPYLCSEQPLNKPDLLEYALAYAKQYPKLNVLLRG